MHWDWHSPFAFAVGASQLNRFIHTEALPEELARRMREYFHQSKHLRAAKSQQALLSALPPKLQGEASWATNQSWLTSIAFLQNAEPQFMLELSLHLHAVIFSPSDLAPTGFMFIVQRGIAIYRGKVRTKGQVTCEDVFAFRASLLVSCPFVEGARLLARRSGEKTSFFKVSGYDRRWQHGH